MKPERGARPRASPPSFYSALTAARVGAAAGPTCARIQVDVRALQAVHRSGLNSVAPVPDHREMAARQPTPAKVAALFEKHGHVPEQTRGISMPGIKCTVCDAVAYRAKDPFANHSKLGAWRVWIPNTLESHDCIVGTDELWECPGADELLCDAVACLLTWLGYAVTKLAQVPNTREVVETIMKCDLDAIAPHERWSLTAVRAAEAVSFVTRRLGYTEKHDLTRALWHVQSLEAPAHIWSADALQQFCRAIALLDLQLPELESMLVSMGATWNGGDPRQWAEAAHLMSAQPGYVPQLTMRTHGFDFAPELYDKLEALADEYCAQLRAEAV
jgi:hypothetical protein